MLHVMHRFIVLAVLLVACSKDKGPPCAKIVDHMLDVTKQALPGHDSEGFGDRKGMVAQCEKRNYSREMRKCLMAATSLAGFGECQAKGKPTPAPTRPLPSTEPPPPPTGAGSAPAPAGSGS